MVRHHAPTANVSIACCVSALVIGAYSKTLVDCCFLICTYGDTTGDLVVHTYLKFGGCCLLRCIARTCMSVLACSLKLVVFTLLVPSMNNVQ